MEHRSLYNLPNFEVYDRLCAFNLYWCHGYETAVSIYPKQEGFILAHMDKTLQQVRKACYYSAEASTESETPYNSTADIN